MKSNGSPEIALPLSRRAAIGLGVASGLALASFAAEDLLAKAPPKSADMDPHLAAAWKFAMKSGLRAGNGYWAISYSEDKFAGEPLLFTKPSFLPKPQTGAMPNGWGAKAGSIVVGPSAVLRLVHKVNGQDVHVTLLPEEMMSDMRTMGISDGQCSWKLFPVGNLHPPY